MYHYDGHRACGVSFSPEETKKRHGTCPQCKKPLTIGVLNRVDNLADRKLGQKSENKIPFRSLVGLDDVIAEALDVKGRKSKAVSAAYENLIAKGKNEFNILLELSYDELGKITSPQIVEGVKRNREGKVFIEPGFDGQYGVVKLFSPKEKKKARQNSLF